MLFRSRASYCRVGSGNPKTEVVSVAWGHCLAESGLGGSGAAGVCSGLVGLGCVGELVAPSQRVSRFRRRERRTYI